MRPYERNHDGAALGPSVGVTEADQRSVYPYTVQGSASFPDYQQIAKRQNMLHTTYLYLAVAVVGAMGGAWFGAHSEPYLKFAFGSPWVWLIGIMLLINVLPAITIKIAHNTPRLAVPALLVEGFISGMALAPAVFIGLYFTNADPNTGGNVVTSALMITAAMFAGITAYVFINKANFRPIAGIGWALFGGVCVLIPLQFFFQSALIGGIIGLAIGALGIYQIATMTSTLCNDPNFDSPATGALVLFAGLFNLFQSILYVLSMLSGRD